MSDIYILALAFGLTVLAIAPCLRIERQYAASVKPFLDLCQQIRNEAKAQPDQLSNLEA